MVHNHSPSDDRSISKNPNNPAYYAAIENRATQIANLGSNYRELFRIAPSIGESMSKDDSEFKGKTDETGKGENEGNTDKTKKGENEKAQK